MQYQNERNEKLRTALKEFKENNPSVSRSELEFLLLTLISFTRGQWSWTTYDEIFNEIMPK